MIQIVKKYLKNIFRWKTYRNEDRILVQKKANGIPEAFIVAKKYIKNQNVCLMLGDNFFYGQGFYNTLNEGLKLKKGAFFLIQCSASRKLCCNRKKNNHVISIEEKPKLPKTNLAIPGIYFFDKNVVSYCKTLIKSKRNELEIVDLLKIYIKKKLAKFKEIRRGISWLDMGSFDDLNDCSNYIRAIEKRQNFMISSPEK